MVFLINEKPASKLNRQAFRLIKKVLYYIGYPFYLGLSHVIVALFYLFYLTGHITRLVFSVLFFRPIRRLKLATKPKKARIPKKKIRRLVYKAPVLLPFFRSLSTRLRLLVLKTGLLISGKKHPVEKSFRPRTGIKVRYLFLSVFVFFFILIPFLFWLVIFKNLPSPSDLQNRNLEVSTKIYDRNGILLYKIYKDKNRTPIALDKIPLNVRLATLAAEDAEFYSHPGFSIKGITRSLFKNVAEGKLSGGSTITQQLVKNALLSPEKTITRKIREVVLAMMVEMKYSKDEILEMYLNEVGYGGTAYGVSEAAMSYFGKTVNKLSLAEAAFIAGLPKSPTKFSPFGANPELAYQRQQEVLHLMRINSYISADQEKDALAEKINFSSDKTDIKAPHFVIFVRQLLEEKFGKEIVETGGLEVTTTLDYGIQTLAEEVVAAEVEKLRGLNVTNGAALVLNPIEGEILAMVGSKNYFDTARDGNVNVTLALRQPGSSIKVVNYGYALSNGYTPATIISDIATSFNVRGQAPYIPKNYDGTYKGDIPLRIALAESRNIPAVRVLSSYGVDKMIDLGTKMGITTWNDKDRFGLSLTLGGGEVRLIDLARVYATIANYGTRPTIKSLLSVKNYQGKELFNSQNKCEENISRTEYKNEVDAAEARFLGCGEESVLDPRVAFILTDILKDNSARSGAFGSYSQLVIPNHPEVAVKTGTSNNLRDNLTVGYNQKYLTAVWVGNNNNSPMSRVASGVTGASPIWNKIMTALIANDPSAEWRVPAGVTKTEICLFTGTLPCNGCPTRAEWFLNENLPKYACNPEVIKKINEGKSQGKILEPAAQTSI